MNVLFLSLGVFDDLSQGSVHIDLIKRFAEDHAVWLVCKNEGKRTELTYEYGINVLRVHTGTLKKIGLIRKGINTVLVEPQFTYAIRKYLSSVVFDLVLYTTPPITFAEAIRAVKKNNPAFSFLMLKDIFPQNAVDLGMMRKDGIKGLLYRYFRHKEKELYELSDYIGCMSPANIEYILKHNCEINLEKVGMCPNATVIEDKSVDQRTKEFIRNKYNLPDNKKIFVYGGNLGKPQGIPFLIDCLRSNKDVDAFFLIIGQGTEYKLIADYINSEKPENCMLIEHMPKNDFEVLVAACDVGMIFLDHRFTIPNFPSRMLSYMKAQIPIIAATDPNTDIGKIITEGKFGWWCESDNVDNFSNVLNIALNSELKEMGNRGFEYMASNYSVDIAYKSILEKVKAGQA